MNQKQYKNIIFDLGGVIFYFNFKKLLNASFPNKPIPELKALWTPAILDICRADLTIQGAIERLSPQLGKQGTEMFFAGITKDFTLIDKGLEIFNTVKQKNYNTYILSNMYTECFDAIKHHDFLNTFDGAVYSHLHRCIKPDTEIYNLLLSTYNLNPEECLFIDDIQENIDGAQACNIDGILCDDHDRVERELKVLGVLQ